MTSYPLHLRTALQSGKARSQPAAFSLAEPRRGAAYARATGTDTPVFWQFTFRFTQAEALVFMLWFREVLNRGIDEFTMPIRTEFGMIEHTCRFVPDSLLDTTEDAELFTYRATIMARSMVVPQEYTDAAALIAGLPDWTSWAEYLDSAVTDELPV